MLYLISAGEDLFPTFANIFHQFPLPENVFERLIYTWASLFYCVVHVALHDTTGFSVNFIIIRWKTSKQVGCGIFMFLVSPLLGTSCGLKSNFGRAVMMFHVFVIPLFHDFS